MFEKAYKSRYHYVRAVQYDGTAEMTLDLVNEYHGLIEAGGWLYFETGSDDDGLVIETDWLIIQNGWVKAVVPDEYFDMMYTRVKIEEFMDNTPAKDVITDVDLREIDDAEDR